MSESNPGMEYLQQNTAPEPYVDIYSACVRSRKLSPNEWRLYCVLSTYAGCKDVFPSQSTLSKKTNLGVRTVVTLIQNLVDLGLLKKETQINRFNGNSECLYTLIDYMDWFNANPFYYVDVQINTEADIIYVPTGHIQISHELLFTERLTAVQLRAYCALLTYAYKGTINPTYEQLAKDVNVSRRKITETIESLDELKLIKKERDDDYLRPNKYTVFSYNDWLHNS